MQCPCGGMALITSHVVTTEQGAKKWADYPPPLRIDQHKCQGCGRQFTRIYKQGRLVEER
jgi:hypothetical protein